MDRLHLIIVDISRDATDLSAQLRSLQLDQSKNIEALGQGLAKVAEERHELLTALTSHRESKEARCQAREQQMIRKLGLKAASFRMGFDGVVK